MTTGVNIEERWTFLEPWTRVLKRQFSNVLYRLQLNPIDLAQFYVNFTVQDESQVVEEGIKLLAAVAHVDDNAWKYLLHSHCGVKIDVDGDILVCFWLRIYSDNQTVSDLVQMCGIQQHYLPHRGQMIVDVKMVLERCPNLEQFCLIREQDTAVFKFPEYHATGTPLPALTFKFDNIPGFTKELRNTDSALSKCLQRLTLHHNYYLVKELDAFLKMLESNEHLEHLSIKPYLRCDEYIERFKRFHLLPISRSYKLDAQSKIAFLSVLSTTSRHQNETRLQLGKKLAI